MRKFIVLTSAVVMALGVGAASSSAFAMGCLTNQASLPPISLAQSAMVTNAGFEYDKATYDANLAKGNACSATQQSQPVSVVQSNGNTRARVTNNN
jgi:nickel-dependent lactate racemase